jgi:hypothetical protein
MDQKSILLSKTFWGAILMLIATSIPKLGITSDQASHYADQVVLFLGFCLTMYGRITAQTKVTFSLPKKKSS